MAAILNFRHPISQVNILNGATEFLGPETWVDRWNLVSISSGSRDKGISGLPTAILNFRLPVTSIIIRNSTIVFLNPEDLGVAVEISFLSDLDAEKRFSYYSYGFTTISGLTAAIWLIRQNVIAAMSRICSMTVTSGVTAASWIFNFNLHQAVFTIVPLSS